MQELRTAPRQRRSQQSIEAILDAAERLIHEQGQVAFTANELAVAANMSIGRVYYWFPDMPSVVNALAERAGERLSGLVSGVLQLDPDSSTDVMINSVIDELCRHIDESPSTVALCLSGSGVLDYGQGMRARIVDIVATLLRDRVPGIEEPEVQLVANTATGIALGMLHAYLKSPTEYRPVVRDELVYVLAAWLYARYPAVDDPVWNDPDAALRPSRRPREVKTMNPVHPGLAPATAGV